LAGLVKAVDCQSLVATGAERLLANPDFARFPVSAARRELRQGAIGRDFDLEAQLSRGSTLDVENELARMKVAISAGPSAAPQAIESQQAPLQGQQPSAQASEPPSIDAQPGQECHAPPNQDQEAPPAQPQGDLR
jgi:hypothetical protein